MLEHEVEQAARKSEAFAAAASATGQRATLPASREGSSGAMLGSGPRGGGGRTEQQVLRLLIASEEWRARASGLLQPEWFESPAHRELFEALLVARDPGFAPPPANLSEPLRELWQRIAATDVPLDPAGQANLFEAASRKLEARPQLRAWRQLNDRIKGATGSEQAVLLAQKDSVARALQQKFPEEFRLFGFQLGRRAVRRPATDG